MNAYSEVDSGQRFFDYGGDGVMMEKNDNLAIFVGTRRGPENAPPSLATDGTPQNEIEMGATINGVEYDPAIQYPNDPNGRDLFSQDWGIVEEFENGSAEKWGFELWDIIANSSIEDLLLVECQLLLNTDTLDGTYEKPFEFYYLGGEGGGGDEERVPPIYDWNLYRELPHQPSGVGGGTSTFDDQDRDDEELTGDSSYGVFGS